MSDGVFNPVHKDDFNKVYDLVDPRLYYRGLQPTNYRMPEVVAGLIVALEDRIKAARGLSATLHVLDFACGYGAVGALARHRLGMGDLYRHYAQDAPQAGSVVGHDRGFFSLFRGERSGPRITGIDIAGEAVNYARALGFIDVGYAENLTENKPSVNLARELSNVDLVVESGSLPVALPNAFRAIIELGRHPWILYCPRPDSDLRDLDELWKKAGYRAEVAGPRSVAYRKPLGDSERNDVLRQASEYGRSGYDAIANGYIRVPVMLARSNEDAQAVSVDELVCAHHALFDDPE